MPPVTAPARSPTSRRRWRSLLQPATQRAWSSREPPAAMRPTCWLLCLPPHVTHGGRCPQGQGVHPIVWNTRQNRRHRCQSAGPLRQRAAPPARTMASTGSRTPALGGPDPAAPRPSCAIASVYANCCGCSPRRPLSLAQSHRRSFRCSTQRRRAGEIKTLTARCETLVQAVKTLLTIKGVGALTANRHGRPDARTRIARTPPSRSPRWAGTSSPPKRPNRRLSANPRRKARDQKILFMAALAASKHQRTCALYQRLVAAGKSRSSP